MFYVNSATRVAYGFRPAGRMNPTISYGNLQIMWYEILRYSGFSGNIPSGSSVVGRFVIPPAYNEPKGPPI